MFSGIIQSTGRVVKKNPRADGSLGLTLDIGGLLGADRLRTEDTDMEDFPEYGASICVNGCCLTVARRDEPERTLGFDVIPESLSRTTLGSLVEGDLVNLEQSVRPTTRLDGHMVQGHVEGVGEVLSIDETEGWVARIAPPRELMPTIVPKGSIAVEGVSLTIAGVEVRAGGGGGSGGWFEIALIPTTLSLTTLGMLKPGSKVNLETDVMARTTVHWLTHFGAGVGDGVGDGSGAAGV